MKKRMIDLFIATLIGLVIIRIYNDLLVSVFSTVICFLAVENYRFGNSKYKNIYILIAIVALILVCYKLV